MSMDIPIYTKPAVWGALGGAVVITVVGFSWLGWTTGGASETLAQERARSAVISALAPVCVERFMRAGGAPAALGELKKIDTWAQGDFIEKGGWAAAPGTPPTDQVTAVARACALLLLPT
jgi:hypothetical protein